MHMLLNRKLGKCLLVGTMVRHSSLLDLLLYFTSSFINLAFANERSVTTTAFANYCGPSFLPTPVMKPAKTREFQQSVDLFFA